MAALQPDPLQGLLTDPASRQPALRSSYLLRHEVIVMVFFEESAGNSPVHVRPTEMDLEVENFEIGSQLLLFGSENTAGVDLLSPPLPTAPGPSQMRVRFPTGPLREEWKLLGLTKDHPQARGWLRWGRSGAVVEPGADGGHLTFVRREIPALRRPLEAEGQLLYTQLLVALQSLPVGAVPDPPAGGFSAAHLPKTWGLLRQYCKCAQLPAAIAVNALQTESGYSLLCVASAAGLEELVVELLDAGADPWQCTADGFAMDLVPGGASADCSSHLQSRMRSWPQCPRRYWPANAMEDDQSTAVRRLHWSWSIRMPRPPASLVCRALGCGDAVVPRCRLMLCRRHRESTTAFQLKSNPLPELSEGAVKCGVRGCHALPSDGSRQCRYHVEWYSHDAQFRACLNGRHLELRERFGINAFGRPCKSCSAHYVGHQLSLEECQAALGRADRSTAPITVLVPNGWVRVAQILSVTLTNGESWALSGDEWSLHGEGAIVQLTMSLQMSEVKCAHIQRTLTTGTPKPHMKFFVDSFVNEANPPTIALVQNLASPRRAQARTCCLDLTGSLQPTASRKRSWDAVNGGAPVGEPESTSNVTDTNEAENLSDAIYESLTGEPTHDNAIIAYLNCLESSEGLTVVDVATILESTELLSMLADLGVTYRLETSEAPTDKLVAARPIVRSAFGAGAAATPTSAALNETSPEAAAARPIVRSAFRIDGSIASTTSPTTAAAAVGATSPEAAPARQIVRSAFRIDGSTASGTTSTTAAAVGATSPEAEPARSIVRSAFRMDSSSAPAPANGAAGQHRQ